MNNETKNELKKHGEKIAKCGTWTLSGKHNRFIRQDIMSAIKGKKTPLSKCGITDLIWELYCIALMPCDLCGSEQEEHLSKWINLNILK